MATHGRARDKTEQYLCARRPFRRSGYGMSAIEGAVSDPGRLPDEHAREYMTAANLGEVTYTVLSYATPILWVLRDGSVISPQVGYSPTTAQHQSFARGCVR